MLFPITEEQKALQAKQDTELTEAQEALRACLEQKVPYLQKLLDGLKKVDVTDYSEVGCGGLIEELEEVDYAIGEGGGLMQIGKLGQYAD